MNPIIFAMCDHNLIRQVHDGEKVEYEFVPAGTGYCRLKEHGRVGTASRYGSQP